MSNNVAEVPKTIDIEIPDGTQQPMIKESLKPETSMNRDTTRHRNGVKEEEQAIASPKVQDAANEKAEDDFINGLIAGLDDMTQETKESKTKKIEKRTGEKIQEIIDWVSAILSTAYVKTFHKY